MQNVLKTEPTMGGPKDFLCFSELCSLFATKSLTCTVAGAAHNLFSRAVLVCSSHSSALEGEFLGDSSRRAVSRMALKVFQVGIEDFFRMRLRFSGWH